jgi:L-threonylcarbamoyladenylate synthase
LLVTDLGPRDRLEVAAARLYAALRDLDRAGVDRILALDVSGDGGLAAAIRDRLTRAAAGRVILVD